MAVKLSPAMKRVLLSAELNFGGVYTVHGHNRLRRIMTISALRERGLVERHPHAGDVLSGTGLAARARLLERAK